MLVDRHGEEGGVGEGADVLIVADLGIEQLLQHCSSDAQQQAYRLAEQIRWNGMFYRHDIGYRAIARERQ